MRIEDQKHIFEVGDILSESGDDTYLVEIVQLNADGYRVVKVGDNTGNFMYLNFYANEMKLFKAAKDGLDKILDKLPPTR